MMKSFRRGFTLLELMLVVAILSIIAVLAVGKYGDFRKEAARKANVASINNISRAVATELARTDKVVGMFNYLESLVDANCADGAGAASATDASGYLWAGEGWANAPYTPGVYAGVKEVGNMSNAGGVQSQTESLASYREQNSGLGAAAVNFGIRYLSEKEVEALRTAGVEILLYHNWMNSQSKLAQTRCGRRLADDLSTRDGGPGLRPDMSAFFPVRLTNGVPVAVLDPIKSEKTYRALGCTYPDNTTNLATQEDYYAAGAPRLVCFGLGRSSDLTAALFTNPPRDSVLDKTRYRNYILVFKMLNGTGNTGSTVTFVGVIDPEGNAAGQAIYNADWAG